jgi:hypothetical protein
MIGKTEKRFSESIMLKQEAEARTHRALEHDPEKWKAGFPKRSCSNKELRS